MITRGPILQRALLRALAAVTGRSDRSHGAVRLSVSAFKVGDRVVVTEQIELTSELETST